jgi:signal transduction histidine kinase
MPLGGQDVATLIFETGHPARVDRSAADDSSPVATTVRRPGGQSAVGAPISLAGRLWGAAILTMRSEKGAAAHVQARLADFADLVATAISNTEAQAQLTASRVRIVASADETRRRIERDLHDGAQQRLVTLALQVRAAQAKVPTGLGEVTAELDHVAAGLEGALDELRDLARGIHPATLAQDGLGPALKALVRRSSVPVRLDLRVGARLPRQIEVGAYYVISEALTNVAKHAHATLVAVRTEVHDDVLHISVRDNGCGGADLSRGSGLIGLRDRVEALRGQLSLYSPPGTGTDLQVEFPLADGITFG